MKKNGLLLVNLGSPDTPTTPDVKRYLKEFLSDRNVIEMPQHYGSHSFVGLFFQLGHGDQRLFIVIAGQKMGPH